MQVLSGHHSPGHPIAVWGHHFGPNRGSSKPDGRSGLLVFALEHDHHGPGCTGSHSCWCRGLHNVVAIPRPTHSRGHKQASQPPWTVAANSWCGVVCMTDHSRLPRGRPVLAAMYASLHRRTGMPSPAAEHVTLSPSGEHKHSTACTNDTIMMRKWCSYLAGKDGDVSH